jgi:cytochrome P450
MNNIAKINDFDDLHFDPFAADDEGFGDLIDLHQRIARLRREGPVLQGDFLSLMGLAPDKELVGLPHYTVVGHKEVAQAFGDPVTFSNDVLRTKAAQNFGETLGSLNPPLHTRYRRIFQQAFLPNVITTWDHSLLTPVANDLINTFSGRGSAELINEFARPYPFHVIFHQLELPEEDIAVFQKLAVAQINTFNQFLPYAIEASQKLGVYFSEMMQERRRVAGDGLVDVLLNMESDGERVPDIMIISFLRQLINAAGDTTYRSIGTLFAALLSNPDQYRAVANDRSLLPMAIEEALRWDGPVVFSLRTVMRDCELGGVAISAGAILNICNAAYNRDPVIHSDPDRFDVFRKRTRHLAFGNGPHVCIGQHLARLKMLRAASIVMDRLRNLRLDPDKPPPEIRGVVFRTPRSVHVRFG